MLITLCYVYMWVRFHKCYSVMIHRGLSRLKTGSSFSFSILPSSAAASASNERPEVTSRGSTAQTQDVLFLQIGDKAVHVTEPQVRGSIFCLPLLSESYLPWREGNPSPILELDLPVRVSSWVDTFNLAVYCLSLPTINVLCLTLNWISGMSMATNNSFNF